MMSYELLGFVLAVTINVGTMIWMAATMKSELKSLGTAFRDHVKDEDKRVGDIEVIQVAERVRVAVLWDGHERREGVPNRRAD